MLCISSAGKVSDEPLLHELEYLQCMRDQSPHHPGYSHVLQLRDHFYQKGSEYRHLCLVMEPLAEDLHSFSKHFLRAQLANNLIKRIARQVILGLQYLHEECNIIHTGMQCGLPFLDAFHHRRIFLADIKPSNILMKVNHDVVSAAAASLPVRTSVGTSPEGRQITRVESQGIAYPIPEGDLNSDATWRQVEIRLADVGVCASPVSFAPIHPTDHREACWGDKVDEHFTDLIQSPALRAPEVCIGAGWGKPADIWSLGCTVGF